MKHPSILILESWPDVADALQDALASAHYTTIVRPHLDRLADLGVRPAAIVTRITSVGVGEPPYRAIESLRENRPPIVAIAWADSEVAEAARLKCDVVLRAPSELGRLCEALTKIVFEQGDAQARASAAAGVSGRPSGS
jgi:hypothetical protein